MNKNINTSLSDILSEEPSKNEFDVESHICYIPDSFGFSAAGTRQKQQRPFRCQYRLLLLGVEMGKPPGDDGLAGGKIA